jgi:hypothetical protein
MTERLPITITTSRELNALLSNKINSMVNKLEAQFNFQTMMANWYGDEEEVLCIGLVLHYPQGFSLLRANSHEQAVDFSDDVFILVEQTHELLCHIAITESELVLLTAQPKLYFPLLQAKLSKVLALIAQHQNLPLLVT